MSIYSLMIITFKESEFDLKKEFTSFDVAVVVQELKEVILDARVNNVYQLNDKTLLFKLHKPDLPAFRLVLEAGKRLHLTSYVLEKPLVPPAFCMALRKHLRNAWLDNVEQYEFERIVIFSFKTRIGNIRFVVELFGEGNFILVNDENRILQALVYKRMRDRNIIRGEIFAYPPSSGLNPFKITKEEFGKGLKNFGDAEVVRAIARFLSIGGVYAEEVLSRAKVDKAKPSNALSEEELDTIFNSLQFLLSLVANRKIEPTVVLDESDGFVDVTPFRLKRYDGFKHKLYGSFNEALDEFYVRTTAVEKALEGVEVDKLKREVERLKRMIESQEKALMEAETKAELNKHIGDVIYSHANELQVLLDKFSVAKKSGKEWAEIVSKVFAEKKAGVKPSIYFESFDAESLLVNVRLDGLGFGLDLRKTVFENAAEFYERRKRAKQKLEGAKNALEKTRSKLKNAEMKISEAEAIEHAKPAEALQKLAECKVKHKKWFEKFRWFTSSEGFLVVAGKDAVSNEVLIKKYADAEDIVFHADIVGAPFVVIKTEGKKPSEQTLREAGELAAAFSRGWREGFGSVDVYWVKPSQLSKGGPSGESVPRGGFVVRGERNWMRNVPLRIAIGFVVNEEGKIHIVGGPVDAVKAKADAYIVVVPGDGAGKELFRRVLKALAGKVSRKLHNFILELSVEAVREYIPYGKGIIKET